MLFCMDVFRNGDDWGRLLHMDDAMEMEGPVLCDRRLVVTLALSTGSSSSLMSASTSPNSSAMVRPPSRKRSDL